MTLQEHKRLCDPNQEHHRHEHCTVKAVGNGEHAAHPIWLRPDPLLRLPTMRCTNATSLFDNVVDSHPTRVSVSKPSPLGPRCLSQRWLRTANVQPGEPKAGLLLSMEFLSAGPSHNETKPDAGPLREAIKGQTKSRFGQLSNRNPMPASGTAGLAAWRLASSTRWRRSYFRRPATALGTIRHFQAIHTGWLAARTARQLATPPDPWEVARPDEKVEVKLNCSFEVREGRLRASGPPFHAVGVPYDRPVVGYGGKTINTLRLWAAAAPIISTSRSSATAISSARWPGLSRGIPDAGSLSR